MPTDLDVALEALGYTVTVKLIRDDFDGREGSHTFAIKLGRNGQTYETEYAAGCGHRHYPLRGGGVGRMLEFSYRGGMSVDELAKRKRSIPNNPTLADVVNCILSDAQAVADGQSFEDFAHEFGYDEDSRHEFGYDEDSRRAEKCFNGCRDSYFALVRMGADFDGLAQLFVDY